MKKTAQKISKLPLSIVRQIQGLLEPPLKTGRKLIQKTKGTGRRLVSKGTRKITNTKKYVNKATKPYVNTVRKTTKPYITLVTALGDTALFHTPSTLHKMIKR